MCLVRTVPFAVTICSCMWSNRNFPSRQRSLFLGTWQKSHFKSESFL